MYAAKFRICATANICEKKFANNKHVYHIR